VAVSIAVPAAAQLACTPVLVLAFGQLTPYAVPANLLAAPAVAPATVLGVICAVVASITPPIAVPIAWLAALPTMMIAMVARAFSSLPGAGVRWTPGTAGISVVVAAIAALAVGVALRRRQRRRSSDQRAILGTCPP
jgi:competence protein ComEC